MPTVARRAVAVALALLAIAGCRDEPPHPYAALGSSYASGAGIAPEATSCRRSEQGYPSRVAAALGLALDDRTCAGATAADARAAVDGIAVDAELVTITVGGNDIDYTATAEACVAGDCERPTIDTEALRRSLASLVDAVRARAPDARVVLVTYPRLVARGGATCDALGLTDAGARVVADIGRRLEEAFVAVAAATDAVLVDPYAVTGHDVCSGAGRWVEGASVRAPGLPFHPNAAGHAAVAALVVDAVRAG
jgi:lysophospholipase L1-like esterase